MIQQTTTAVAADIADRIVADIDALELQNTPNIRAVRRQYSREIGGWQTDLVLDLAVRLIETRRLRTDTLPNSLTVRIPLYNMRLFPSCLSGLG